jgi:predicted DNA-binding transcriptional regulator AlpA
VSCAWATREEAAADLAPHSLLPLGNEEAAWKVCCGLFVFLETQAMRTDNPPVLPDALLTRADLAKLFRVSSTTLINWEKDGRLPRAVRVGRKPFWTRETIAAFLNNGGATREAS